MGGKSSSNSRQTTNNTSISLGFDGDGNIAGDGNTVIQTDHGAMDAAVDINRDNSLVLRDGLNVLSDVSETALGENSRVSEAAMNSMVDFGATALGEVGRATGDALHAMLGMSDSALSEMGMAYEGAAILGESALDTAAEVSADASATIRQANDNAAQLAANAIATNSDVLADGFAFGERISGHNAELAANALDYGDNANARMLDLTLAANAQMADVSAGAAQVIGDSYRDMLVSSERATAGALELASNVTMDDAAEASVAMSKNFMYAAAAIGVALVLRGAK